MANGVERLAKRVRRIGISAIREMMLLGARTPGSISLAQGVPDTRTPGYVREGIIELLRENNAIGKYSPGSGIPELRRMVAQELSKKADSRVDPDKHICITTGAIEALAISISTLVEEGDEVILPDPGYPPYAEQIAFVGGKAVYMPLQADNGWKIDLEKLKAAITPKTKLLMLASPSNPTGMVTSEDEVEAIVALSKKHGFFIISDITYEFLIYGGAKPASFLDYPEIRDRLLVCYSFSKEFSMTGWRAGYLFGPEYVLEQAMKVHDAFTLCAPTISQYAALVAITKKPDSDPEGMKAALMKKRDIVCARLDALSDLFSYAKPQGAYYVFPRYMKTGLGSRDFAIKMLNEAKVISVPGAGFGPSGEGHLRFSYGASEENLNEAFDRIEKWNTSL